MMALLNAQAEVSAISNDHLLALAAILFAIGIFGFLVRRNAIIVLASVELMLNAANLTFSPAAACTRRRRPSISMAPCSRSS